MGSERRRRRISEQVSRFLWVCDTVCSTANTQVIIAAPMWPLAELAKASGTVSALPNNNFARASTWKRHDRLIRVCPGSRATKVYHAEAFKPGPVSRLHSSAGPEFIAVSEMPWPGDREADKFQVRPAGTGYSHSGAVI